MSMVVQLNSTVANDALTLVGIDVSSASGKEALVTDGVIAGTKIHNLTVKSEESKSKVLRIMAQDRCRLNVPAGAAGWSPDGLGWEEDYSVHTVVTIGPKLKSVLQNSALLDAVVKATVDRSLRLVVAVLAKDNSMSGVASSASTQDVVKNAIVGASLVDTQAGAYGKSV